MNLHDTESQLGCVCCSQEFTLPSAQLFKCKAKFTNKRPFGLRLQTPSLAFPHNPSNGRQPNCVLHLTNGETEVQGGPGWIPSFGS